LSLEFPSISDFLTEDIDQRAVIKRRDPFACGFRIPVIIRTANYIQKNPPDGRTVGGFEEPKTPRSGRVGLSISESASG
jgi:hypothetical protein